MNTSDQYAKTFAGKKIAIIGDLVADQFLKGTIARVSREAPVFILRHEETETRCGAAANAAANVASLGGEPLLVGTLGTDANGKLLAKALAENGIAADHVIVDDHLLTTTKIRVLAGQHYAGKQQVIRIDYENDRSMSGETAAKIRENLGSACEAADAVIVSDYNYGVANSEITDAVREIAKKRGIPLVIDSRFRLASFAGATSATPNLDEFEQIAGSGLTDKECDAVREKLGFDSLLVTCGNSGVLLLERGREPLRYKAVGPLEPVDVTGAGDTVIAAYTMALASGFAPAEAARIANHAGGIVVMKKGTATVSIEELVDSLGAETFTETANK
jgi:rfaE bifunctional protein kinase chain/domain